MKNAQIGIVGLAVMGANLARNFADKKIETVVYNRTSEKTLKFCAKYSHRYLWGATDLEDFVKQIKRPRKIILMVQAGHAVDEVIKQLAPLLKKGDMILDCGNSYYKDTERHHSELAKQGIKFIGCGISGGEEGALHGPSLMPGCGKSEWKNLQMPLEKIAAKDFGGTAACVTLVGQRGAGHYVKMVHNGIEYAMMEIIAETYQMLRVLYKLPAPRIAHVFEDLNSGTLCSYLFEITAQVLKKKDDLTKGYLIDRILDKAEQKGTGKWTAVDALDRAVPASTIAEAVFARITSSQKDRRKKLNKLYPKSTATAGSAKSGNRVPYDRFIWLLEQALYAAIVSCYAQGYDLIATASKENKWEVNLAEVSRIWQGGCIIRAKILQNFRKAFQKKKNAHLFEDADTAKELKKKIPSLREIAALAAHNGISAPAFTSALGYFDAITTENSPANLIQALRDCFGAHTYERTDRKGTFHTDWQN